MTTGSAIILSTILLIVSVGAWRISVAHRWGTVGKVLGVIILLIAVIVGGIYAYQWGQKRPQMPDNLSGIKVGMSEPDVIVKMGRASTVVDEKTSKLLTFTNDYDSDYIFDVGISSSSKKVEVICEAGDFSDLYSSKNTSESELIDRYGEPETTSVEPNGSYKTLRYPRYNLSFIIRLDSLVSVCLSNKAEYIVARDWLNETE